MNLISKELIHPYLIRANRVNVDGMVYPAIYSFKGLTRIKYLMLLKCLDRYDCLDYYLLNTLRLMGYPNVLVSSKSLQLALEHKLRFFLETYQNPIMPILAMNAPTSPTEWYFNNLKWNNVKRSYAGMIAQIKFFKAFEYNNK